MAGFQVHVRSGLCCERVTASTHVRLVEALDIRLPLNDSKAVIWLQTAVTSLATFWPPMSSPSWRSGRPALLPIDQIFLLYIEVPRDTRGAASMLAIMGDTWEAASARR